MGKMRETRETKGHTPGPPYVAAMGRNARVKVADGPLAAVVVPDGSGDAREVEVAYHEGARRFDVRFREPGQMPVTVPGPVAAAAPALLALAEELTDALAAWCPCAGCKSEPPLALLDRSRAAIAQARADQ